MWGVEGVTIGRSNNQVFKFVWDRAWKKLNGWKEKSLSKVGREVFIKLVVQSILTYVMGCFLLPHAICEELESMKTKLYWGGDVGKRKLHWMSLKKLARHKKEGGLGFQFMKAFNLALLTKHWWRVMSSEQSLMARVMKAIYFPNKSLREANKGFRPSYLWSSIMEFKWILEDGYIWSWPINPSIYGTSLNSQPTFLM